jgi:hypothetical protein
MKENNIMKKIFLLVFILIFISGCTSEYIYVDDGYDMQHQACTYTAMPYIKDYVDNREKYIDYNHYMKVNYYTNDSIKNAANARKAYKNYINTTEQNKAFFKIELE